MLSVLHPIDALQNSTAMAEEQERSRASHKLSKKFSVGSSNRVEATTEVSIEQKHLDGSGRKHADDELEADAERTGFSGGSNLNSKDNKDVGKQKKRRTAKKEKSDGSDKKRKDKGPAKVSVHLSNDSSVQLGPEDPGSLSDDGDKKKKPKLPDESRKKRTKVPKKHMDDKELAQLSDGSSQSDGPHEPDDLGAFGHTASDDLPSPLPSSSSMTSTIDLSFGNKLANVVGSAAEKRAPTSPKWRTMPLSSEDQESRSTPEDLSQMPSAKLSAPVLTSPDDSLDASKESSLMASVPPDEDSDEEPMSSWFSTYDERFPNRLSTDSLGRRRGRSHGRPVPRGPDTDSVRLDFAAGQTRRMSSGERQSSSDDLAKKQDERLRINVGGRIFETYISTLRKYPNTLLGTMFHPRNAKLLNLNKQPGASENIFFDRNPRVFEVILDFYRTGTINRPSDISLEMLKEELAFFQIELPEVGITNKRISMELMKLEYMNIMLPAQEYRKMARMKLLSDHLQTIIKILDFIQMKIEKKARRGHNSCSLTFYSPLHYTNSTPPSIFKVISMDEIREILAELLQSKGFEVKETNEYSKTKATSIIGLHDQVVNYNDPKFFTFFVRW